MSKFSSKRTAILVGASVLVSSTVLFAGIVPASANSTPVITFGSWVSPIGHTRHAEAYKTINAQNQGKYVFQPVYIPGSNYNQKIVTELAAGDAPDIFYVNYGMVNTLANNHTLLNLTPYLKKYEKQYPAANLKNYFPASLTGDSIGKQTYALPFIDQPDVMYYNAALFKQAHLPLPKPGWTWPQFLHDAKMLTIPSKNQYGYLQAAGWPPLEVYVWSYGGHMFNPAGTKATVNSPAAIRGLELMQTMVKEKIIPPQAAIENISIENLFSEGKVAMFLGGANDGNYTWNNKPIPTAIAPVPRGTKEVTGNYIAEIGVNAKTKNPALAVKALLELLTQYGKFHVVPPVKQFATAAKLESMDIPGAPNNKIPKSRISTIVGSMKFARPQRALADMTQFNNIEMNDLYDPILLGSETAQQAADKAEQDLNNMLKASK